MAPARKSARTAAKDAAAGSQNSQQPLALPPLQGCKIAISGTFPGQTQAAVQTKITTLGGTMARAVKSDTDYLVSTETDFDKESTKIKDAITQGITIITLDWIEECASKSRKVSEKAYQLGLPPAAKKTNGKKRGASAAPSTATTAVAGDDEDEGEDEPPVAKKARASGRAKKPAAAPPSKAAPPAPKMAAAKGKGKGKAVAAPVKDEDEDEEMVDADAAPTEKEEVAEGQVAKRKDLVVPIDEVCRLFQYTVYIDPNDGMIWDAALNQTNAGNNNNKFYKIQIVTNGTIFRTWTRWGRVGENGQNATLGSGSLVDAMKNFEKKFKDKSGLAWADRLDSPKKGKYVFIEKSYNDDSDEEDDDSDDTAAAKKKENGDDYKPPESKLDPAIQELVGLIFNAQYWSATMQDLNYDANKLPLGKLSKTTITRGFQALKDLAAALQNRSTPGSMANIPDLSNLYYSLIPHAFGRNRPPIIGDTVRLKKEIELLESLSDMKDAQNLMKVERSAEEINMLDRQFAGLNMEEMSPLDHGSQEFRELKGYLVGTRGSTHHVNYDVQQIFRIERQGEFKRFDDSPYVKPGVGSDRRLLWHGSRVTNFGGILSQGLRIAPPEAPATGYMFGKGIYLADMSSKSAGYCCSYISGGTALLLLCEAELCDPIQKLTGAAYDAGETAKKGGMHSTWGQGNTGPMKWKDADCVHPSLKGVQMPDAETVPGPTGVHGAGLFYNEYIVYDVAQVKLKYLFRVKM